MAREKRGSIVYNSTGGVKTRKGTPVPRYLTFRGRPYALVGATGSKREAGRSAAGWRRQFGGALVRRLEPGNFGIYATLKGGK